MNHLTTSIVQSSVPGVTPTCLDDGLIPASHLQGHLTGGQYTRDVLQPVVVPHFDNHPLATRPVYMDDNARSPRSNALTA
jgi:hypothetical protein